MTEREMKRKAAARKARARKARTRRVLTTAVLMLVVCAVSIGGTIAWLTAKTDEVVNTFTYSDINISISETETAADSDGDPLTNSYKMVPGGTITKDPKVTVKADSEACWLFVKLTKSDNYGTYLVDYSMADGWTPLPNADGVYYRAVSDTNTDQEFGVLKDNQLTVQTTVTKTQMEAIKITGQPTLKVQAYAVQSANIESVYEAWRQIDSNYTAPASGTNP